MKKLLSLFILCLTPLHFVYAENEEITHGSLIIPDLDGKKIAVPLEHTEVQADISGFIVRVQVTQKFVNPFDKRIEAVYVLPLPEDAAVDRMTMHIGDRTIKGVIKKRQEARDIYERARRQGKTASLLEQERPNMFTQSVANILPGDTILVDISYVEVLEYEKGAYEFVFPMVVGPRYIPGNPSAKSGSGWSPDTDRVPDASRITPPVLKPGTRTGHDISIRVHLNAGIPVQDLVCKSHPVATDKISNTEMNITLLDKDVIPNKDFVLNYHVLGPELETALLTHRDDGEGYFLLILQPKMKYSRKEIRPKEMVFVVDNSGSMRGEPIAKAKEAMRHAIRNMNPSDEFQIIRFSESASSFSSYPLKNTAENRQKGLHFVNKMHGGGGTRMIEGIKAALGYPPDPNRMRIVLFMTDGYIGNEREIFRETENLLGEARLFSFGVGSSVNRFLLDRMALIGRGAVQYVTLDENTGETVAKFYDRIANPFLTDISIDWGRADVEEVYPSNIPDLFSSQPLAIFGRFENSGPLEITLRGKIGEKEVEFPIEIALPKKEKENGVIKTLWARHQIKDLKLNDLKRTQKTADQITEIALAYNLMTQYTSFVAVEEQLRTDETGNPMTVTVPIPMPEGVSYEGVFGDAPSAFSSRPRMLLYKATALGVTNGAPNHKSRSVGVAREEKDAFMFAPNNAQPQPVDGFGAIQKALNYPEKALLTGLEGRVILNVMISETGAVGPIQPVKSPDPDLEQAAIRAIKSVKWKPAGRRGQPTAAWVTVPVVFQIPGQEERIVATRTFVKRGSFWVEKSYAGQKLTHLRENSKKLRVLSEKHFTVKKIIEKLGPGVVFEQNGKWYKVAP
ncbi:MAG: TonB family protein [bacterium]